MIDTSYCFNRGGH